MRNIIVTGGSRGVGLAIARRLTTNGDRVIAIARNETDEIHKLHQEIQASGKGELHFKPFDLSNLDLIPAFVRGVSEAFGPLDGLVNNAASGASGLLANMQTAQIQQLCNLNIVSPAVLTKYVVRKMMARKSGCIVNIASVIAFNGYNGLSVYGATKAAAVGFTRSLAREVGQFGITVNAVAPGFMETEMTKGLDEENKSKVIRRSALRRLAEPDDVADTVEFLMSDKARNITGTVITVDAGNLA